MRTVMWILAALVLFLAGYLAYQEWWPAKDGMLVVISDPSGAQIWVDLEATDFKTGGPPFPLPAGEHSVMLKLDTLQSDPVAQIVSTKAGRTDTLRFRLFAEEIKRPEIKWKPPSEPVAEAEPTPSRTQSDRQELVIPTGDELRRRSDSLAGASRTAEEVAESLVAESKTPPAQEPLPTTGAVEISSSLLEAQIIVNGKLRPEVTPATLEFPAGTYTFRVEMPGFAPKPEHATLKIKPGEPQQFVFFDLIEKDTVTKSIHIETSPVSGKIFMDSVEVGVGTADVPHDYGIYKITFGPVDGYITPNPVRLSLTPDNPTPQVKAEYVRTFHVMVEANGTNVFATDGDISWTTGVYFEDGGAQKSAALGAKIREIPGSQKFGWELGVGDPNRNPTGGDYIEFKFTIPPDVLPSSPHKLRLFLYRSSRRYTFALSGQSEVVVTINDRMFLNGYRPSYGTDEADLERFEDWPLGGMLTAGENRIMIRPADKNTLYFYLWKLEVE